MSQRCHTIAFLSPSHPLYSCVAYLYIIITSPGPRRRGPGIHAIISPTSPPSFPLAYRPLKSFCTLVMNPQPCRWAQPRYRSSGSRGALPLADADAHTPFPFSPLAFSVFREHGLYPLSLFRAFSGQTLPWFIIPSLFLNSYEDRLSLSHHTDT